jgi:hypothetical protein
MQRFIFIAALAFIFPFNPSGQPAVNLVHNGGFENGGAYWQFTTSGGAVAGGEVDNSERHEGNCSYRISNKTAWGANVFGRIFQFVSGLQPYTTYKVSCWAKGRGNGLTWIGGGPGWYTRTAFPKGDFDWQQFSFTVTTETVADNYELMVCTESPTAALWVDDIRFEAVSVNKEKQDAVFAQMNASIGTLEKRVAAIPDNGSNAYIRLGKAVAQRFLHFARDGRMSGGWVNVQLEEVAQVLDETERIARGNSPVLNWMPPALGSVKMKNGTFYNDGRPWYFYGYGHFNSVIEDLPNFPSLGASLIQDGRAGPSSMSADGTLGGGALSVLQGLDLAAQNGMKVDFLLSPHYYPAWAMAPDVPNGNIGFITFNVFHPKAKDAIGRWAAATGDAIKTKPALFSVCLANEPVYNTSGRDPYTHPLFAAWLKEKHQSIAALNALYATKYKTFDDVPVPPCAMPADANGKRAFYDWCAFNKKMFADWHAWMGSVLKQHGVTAPTHTKIMVFQTLDRDKLGWGVDPELICRATDLAGCDAYAFTGGAYAYDWLGHEFFYDLLHSFRGQSVFNSENHLIPDGSPPVHIPMNHSRSVIWQDGLHHEGSSTIWVWQEGQGNGLDGSIYFRPANIFGAGRAMLDLNRLAPEVTAINHARPRIALLDSQPSIFWEEKYKGSIMSLYAALSFMGEPVTFISERQLAAGTAAKVDCLIVPNATHILDTTPAALRKFAAKGGKILLVGDGCMARDEYDRPVPVPAYPTMQQGADDRATAVVLRAALQPLQFADLRDAAGGQPATGIEFRVVQFGQSVLVPMVNLQNTPQTVSFAKWPNQTAVDLLSGDSIDLHAVHVEPMLPRLLSVGKR